MKVLLTGATGYIGSAVRNALAAAGHEVTALVRSDKAAERIAGEGVTPVLGDMRDAPLITSLAAEADAVVHTASPGDETSAEAENEFADAVLAGLGDRGAAFVRTGGVWVYGQGDNITEETPVDAPPLVAWREAVDERVLRAPGIRAILIAPGVVYGHGVGIPNVVVSAAVADADGEPALTLVGDGTQHWVTVQVDDLAALYVLALEKAEHGSTFIGANGNNPTTRELGEAASQFRGLGGRVLPVAPEAIVEQLGAFGEALLVDQQASGQAARTKLGWVPTRPTLVEVIAAGDYPVG